MAVLPPPPPSPEEHLARALSVLLRTGVLLAALLVFAGGILYLVRYGGATPELGSFHGEPEMLDRVLSITLAASRLNPRGIIQFGLIVLIATPILRVVFSFFSFLQEGDYLYTVLTLIVMIILFFSLLFGA